MMSISSIFKKNQNGLNSCTFKYIFHREKEKDAEEFYYLKKALLVFVLAT
jgi:hypothetical protein